MPVTKQAIKKVRQDKKKAIYNARLRRAYKKAVSDFRKNPGSALLTSAFSALDRAAKVDVIHKNTASRLKSRLSKLVKGSAPTPKKTVVVPAKGAPTTKKASNKKSLK